MPTIDLAKDDLRALNQQLQTAARAAADATDRQIDALMRGSAPHLAEASIHRLPPPPSERGMGCCGTLGVYVAPRV